MKPAAFEYFRPSTVDEALSLLAEHEDAKALAGGQSLIPTMNFRLAQPAALVDLNQLGALAGIGETATGLRIGALTRQRAAETSAAVRARAPLLAEALPWVAHPQIRNRGTMGGSLAHADPAAELPAVMVACDAVFTLKSAKGERALESAKFFTGLFATALEHGELVVAIDIPKPVAKTGWAFLEMARRHGDYALVGVAARVTLDASGAVGDSRVVLLSVGDGPMRSAAAEAALKGQKPGDAAFRAAADAAQRDIDPPGDIHASADYRRSLASVLTRRALEKALQSVSRTVGQ